MVHACEAEGARGVGFRPTLDHGRSNCAGKLVMCRVYGIAYKRPQGEQLDQANPVRNEETGLWQCPFCLKNDFPELSEVSGLPSRLTSVFTGFYFSFTVGVVGCKFHSLA